MVYTWYKLPLFDSWDYDYTIVIENVSYTLRLYYSDRTERWSFDISLEQGNMLLEGESLMPYKVSGIERVESLTGFFWVEPISIEENETYKHPSLLFKYFNFYYIVQNNDLE